MTSATEVAASWPRAERVARARRRVAGVPFRGAVIETGPWTRRLTAVLVVLASVYLALQLGVAFFQAMRVATDFSGYALDGAFQLYNPLRRMAVGELPGRDFPFFHGVGVPWLHFPLFQLLGGNIFASEFTRWVLSPVLFSAAAYVFLRALLGTWQRALIALSVVVATAYLWSPALFEPGNSMIGIRSMSPLLVAAALLWPIKRYRVALGFVQWHTSLLVAYLLLGVAFATGTEQGVAAIGAFLLVRLVVNLRRLGFSLPLLGQTLVDVAAVGVSVLVVLTVLTGGSALAALRYALIDVPGDQGWVFGSLPNIGLNQGSLTWSLLGGESLDLRQTVPGYLVAFVLSIVLVVAAGLMRLIQGRQVAVLVFLWLYGTVVLGSVLGYINLNDQMAPLGRVCATIAVGIGTLVALTLLARAEATVRDWARVDARGAGGIAGRVAGAAALVTVGALIVTATVPPRIEVLQSIPKREVIAKAIAAPAQRDEIISGPGYRDALSAFAPYIEDGASIWATYTSLYSSVQGAFTPAPGGEDYIIHALGHDRRQAYEQGFVDAAPDVVVTTNPQYTIYEEWLWGRYPGFFEQLITHYTLTAHNGSHLLWTRNDGPAFQAPQVDVAISEDDTFSLPGNASDRVRYLALTVRYQADGGALPVVNRLPRFYLQFAGAALGLYAEVLPSDEEEWTIVVPVFPGSEGVDVNTLIDGIAPLASLDLTSASYRELQVPDQNDQLIAWNYCTWKADDERCAP
jgi:hypothetical protein